MTQYDKHELSRIDGEIAELEKKIAVRQEQRREIVNRIGLNKCSQCKGGCKLPNQHEELKP